MSKLQDYLKPQNIDPRRLLSASHQLEASRPEDRVTPAVRRFVSEFGVGDRPFGLGWSAGYGMPEQRPLDRLLRGPMDFFEV